MLHWYFSECVNFTSKRLIHNIHRNHVITIFLSNLAADREWESRCSEQYYNCYNRCCRRNVDSGNLKANYASNNLIG